MIIIKNIEELYKYRKGIQDQSLGLVATMGALHQGHISLVKKSINDNSQTMVSIFVNPTQFDQSNDLDNYPNTLDQDIIKLKNTGVNAVFIPNFNDIYPDNYAFKVHEKYLSNKYCGAHRHGHFTGVLTVVMKLFNLVIPDKAYFGEKDYQQLTLIKNMVLAFFMNIKIISCPIVREEDGLAMSSRNLRLTPEQRKMAPKIYETLKHYVSCEQITQKLSVLGFTVDYVEKLDNRILVAAYLGEVRLIDNIETSNSKVEF